MKKALTMIIPAASDDVDYDSYVASITKLAEPVAYASYLRIVERDNKTTIPARARNKVEEVK